MEDKENEGKLPSCMIRGPGPAYKLPTLVGYEGHDPSRHRNPAYTIRARTQTYVQSVGPGPCYNYSKLTNFGRENPPAYTIGSRVPFKLTDSGPGPGAHSPETVPPMNHSLRAPAYTIKSRSTTKIQDGGPAPNAYILPSCIGPNIPDKTAQGAFTIAGYHELREEVVGPGPAAYTNIDYDLIKRRYPAFSLKWRQKSLGTDNIPGPKYYPLFNSGKRPPMYSFGIRHSICAGTPITDLDED